MIVPPARAFKGAHSRLSSGRRGFPLITRSSLPPQSRRVSVNRGTRGRAIFRTRSRAGSAAPVYPSPPAPRGGVNRSLLRFQNFELQRPRERPFLCRVSGCGLAAQALDQRHEFAAHGLLDRGPTNLRAMVPSGASTNVSRHPIDAPVDGRAADGSTPTAPRADRRCQEAAGVLRLVLVIEATSRMRGSRESPISTGWFSGRARTRMPTRSPAPPCLQLGRVDARQRTGRPVRPPAAAARWPGPACPTSAEGMREGSPRTAARKRGRRAPGTPPAAGWTNSGRRRRGVSGALIVSPAAPGGRMRAFQFLQRPALGAVVEDERSGQPAKARMGRAIGGADEEVVIHLISCAARPRLRACTRRAQDLRAHGQHVEGEKEQGEARGAGEQRPQQAAVDGGAAHAEHRGRLVQGVPPVHGRTSRWAR